MPEAEITRLTIVWSKDTDLALRSHLGAQGSKKGALSKFVEDAVKWRLFDKTVNQARKAFASMPESKLRDTIEDAISNVRKQKRRRLRSRPRK
jgi:hypothetical protein